MKEVLIRVTNILDGCPKAILSVVLTLSFSTGHARDFGVSGTVYDIEEKSMLTLIMERLTQLKEQGVIEDSRQELLARARDYLKNPPRVEGITRTEKARTYFYDPSIILQEDVYSATGQLIHKAGTRFNPADFLPFNKTLVFIDGADQTQLDWLEGYKKTEKGDIKIILIDGPIITLMEEKQEQLFFDQEGTLINRLGIKQVPAIVKQQGRQLRIDEVIP